MAIARLTGQDAEGTSTTASVSATYAATPTQNNLLAAVVFSNTTSANLPAITGWTQAATRTTGSTTTSILYKVAGAGESTTVTATATGATVMRIQIYEYSGVATSSLTDGSSGADSAGATVTSQIAAQAGQVATTNAADLLLAGWGMSATTSAWSVDSSFTLLKTNARLVSADRIVSSTGTYSPTLTWTTARIASGVVAAFKAIPAPIAGDASEAVTAGLTSTGALTELGDAAEAVTAALTTTGFLTRFGVAEVVVTASLSAAGALTKSGDAPLAVAAGLTASGSVTHTADATLTVTATATAAGGRTVGGAAALDVTTTTTASGFRTYPGDATLAATVTLTASATVTRATDASRSVTATLTATAFVTHAGDATLSLTATLTATGLHTLVGAAQMAVVAALRAAYAVPTPPERTLTVPAEDRTVTVPAEDRTITVPAENRTLTVRSSP